MVTLWHYSNLDYVFNLFHFSIVRFVLDVVEIQVGLSQLVSMVRINFVLIAQEHIKSGVRTHVTLV